MAAKHDTTAHAIAGSLGKDAAGCSRCDEDMDDFAVEVRLTVHGSVRATSATQASRAVEAQMHQHLSRISIADLEVDIGEISTRRAVVT